MAAGGSAFDQLRVELCGFGPVAAAVSAVKWLHADSFEAVVLCGIAGAYANSDIAPASAVCFSAVAIDGIGVCEHGALFSGQALGFHPALPDCLDCLLPFPGAETADRLLTVCIASESSDQAAKRQHRYACAAEDMEGFSVAAACRSMDVPISILRGISNFAGDREKSRWCIPSALGAVADLISRQLD